MQRLFWPLVWGKNPVAWHSRQLTFKWDALHWLKGLKVSLYCIAAEWNVQSDSVTKWCMHTYLWIFRYSIKSSIQRAFTIIYSIQSWNSHSTTEMSPLLWFTRFSNSHDFWESPVTPNPKQTCMHASKKMMRQFKRWTQSI